MMEEHTETKYDHYNRYGVIFPLTKKTCVSISSYRPTGEGVKWTTSSIGLNGLFKMRADTEKAAAIVLTSVISEKYEKNNEVILLC